MILNREKKMGKKEPLLPTSTCGIGVCDDPSGEDIPPSIHARRRSVSRELTTLWASQKTCGEEEDDQGAVSVVSR